MHNAYTLLHKLETQDKIRDEELYIQYNDRQRRRRTEVFKLAMRKIHTTKILYLATCVCLGDHSYGLNVECHTRVPRMTALNMRPDTILLKHALPRSFTFSLFMLLTFLCLPHLITAQLSIQNISTNTVIDLYKMHNGDSVIDPMSTLFSWQIYNEKGPIPRAFYDFDENVEIIAGPAEAAGNDVVDIVAMHLIYSTKTYWFPASLPLGLYHARINSNITSTSSSGGYKNYQVSARSPTINVTTSFPIGCGPKVPSPFTNVASPSSPAFTSINIHEPSAGHNVVFSNRTSLPPIMNIEWLYRDQRNDMGAGISDVSAQIIDSATSSPVGPAQKRFRLSPIGFASAKFADVPMEVGGSYRVVLTYKNNIQDGLVSPGNVVTFTTGFQCGPVRGLGESLCECGGFVLGNGRVGIG